jgi:replicative superfamily II helicase
MFGTDRGHLLELIVSKMLFLAPHIRIVAMSATLSNIDEIGRWLNAQVFNEDYRPTPLVQVGRPKLTICSDEVS